ncbi:MAG: polyhydroxyalkanoate depolymerase [Proteobacteria bacterium]|jgi:poly(3-hydroxybutyrate) depolymerase|nr:polyhydroxyalkanoate depolymerase [Alphaproteobacteria bacterium]NCC03826.1 polyhydroxyalkanoate depolymerase [Pseudomonadota bacterium]
MFYYYSLHDLHKMMLLPWRYPAQLFEQYLNSSLCPFTDLPVCRTLASGASTIEMSVPNFGKPTFGITATKFRGEDVTVREKVIEHMPFCNLVSFQRESKVKSVNEHIANDPTLLIIPPMSGHFASLLRGTVEAMLPSHNVFVTDWLDAKMVPLCKGYFDLEDQIGYLIQAIKKLGEDVHILAVGQSSLSALAAVSLIAAENPKAQPGSLTLIGGPIDARKIECPFTEISNKRPLSWYRQEQIQMVPAYYPGALRRVYPGMMQLIDRMSMVVNQDVKEQLKYFQYLTRGDEDSPEAHKKLYQIFMSVMDVPEEFHIQFVERAYQNHALANGSFMWRGQKVDPAAITHTAILTVEAELDEISPPGHTRAALDMCTSLPDAKKMDYMQIGVRHYGAFTGRKWRNVIQPVVHGFIREHCGNETGVYA